MADPLRLEITPAVYDESGNIAPVSTWTTRTRPPSNLEAEYAKGYYWAMEAEGMTPSQRDTLSLGTVAQTNAPSGDILDIAALELWKGKAEVGPIPGAP